MDDFPPYSGKIENFGRLQASQKGSERGLKEPQKGPRPPKKVSQAFSGAGLAWQKLPPGPQGPWDGYGSSGIEPRAPQKRPRGAVFANPVARCGTFLAGAF